MFLKKYEEIRKENFLNIKGKTEGGAEGAGAGAAAGGGGAGASAGGAGGGDSGAGEIVKAPVEKAVLIALSLD